MNIESNIVIAKFMGRNLPYRNNFNNRWECMVEDVGLVNSDNVEALYKFLPYNYDTDWNLLMEVVNKIEILTYKGNDVQFKITKYAVCIQTVNPLMGNVINTCVFGKWKTYGGIDKIQAVYRAALEFIIRFNNDYER